MGARERNAAPGVDLGGMKKGLEQTTTREGSGHAEV